MTFDQLKHRIPEHAKDLRLNLAQLDRITTLSPIQLWGAVLASALASREEDVIQAAEVAARMHMTGESRRAARAAAAVMAMNNVYYRFTHLVSNEVYAHMPARLRMQILGNPGVDRLDFELWCLGVSAIYGCGACIDSHERAVTEAGTSAEAVQDVVRVAAIIHGVAATLAGARASESAAGAPDQAA